MKNTFLALFILVSGISFSQENFEPPKISNEPDKDSVYLNFDVPAEFPGGRAGLMTFLANNMHYPKTAIENELQGKCYLRFVIDTEGVVSNVRVSRGVPNCPECDEEAVRVIKSSPKWIPAKLKDKKIKSYFDLPINFNLN